jgi:hypothetical protein
MFPHGYGPHPRGHPSWRNSAHPETTKATTICYKETDYHPNIWTYPSNDFFNMENSWRVPMKMIYKSYKSWISRITPSKSGWNHQNVSHSMCIYPVNSKSHISHPQRFNMEPIAMPNRKFMLGSTLEKDSLTVFTIPISTNINHLVTIVTMSICHSDWWYHPSPFFCHIPTQMLLQCNKWVVSGLKYLLIGTDVCWAIRQLPTTQLIATSRTDFTHHRSLSIPHYWSGYIMIYIYIRTWYTMKYMYISFTHLKYKRPCWHSSPNPIPFQFLGDVATCLAMGRASLFQLKVVPLMEGKTAPRTFVTWGSLCCGTGGKVEQPAGSIATKYHCIW